MMYIDCNVRWKEIKGYEGKYLISNWGKVYSSSKKSVLNPYETHGYSKVKLYSNNKRKTFRVHRLVAGAFLYNPDDLPEVDHKNDIRWDNRASNLKWCSRKYNMKKVFNKMSKKRSNNNGTQQR